MEQLKQCGNVVTFDQSSCKYNCKQSIEDYQQDNNEYQIVYDFGVFDSSSILSIDNKIGVLEIIDTFNANSKVGRIEIGLRDRDRQNDQIISLITSRYTNIYGILVVDYNDLVDHQIHDWIKQYV